jgi:hypothetical protein
VRVGDLSLYPLAASSSRILRGRGSDEDALGQIDDLHLAPLPEVVLVHDRLPPPLYSFTSSTVFFTDWNDFWSSVFSAADSSSSITFSTPPAPMSNGTPMKKP